MVDDIVNTMGIDKNTFWSMMAVLISAMVVPFISGLYGVLKKKCEEKYVHWDVDKKYVENKFYLWILIISFCVSWVINFLFFFCICLLENCIVSCLIEVLLLGMVIWWFNKWKTVKLGLLGIDKWLGQVLISVPVILLTIGMNLYIAVGEMVGAICLIIMIIFEIVGLQNFFCSCTVYQNSYANIILNTSEKIEAVEVDKICKTGKWLVVRQDNIKRVILFDNVCEIMYYGATKYVLRKFER